MQCWRPLQGRKLLLTRIALSRCAALCSILYPDEAVEESRLLVASLTKKHSML